MGLFKRTQAAKAAPVADEAPPSVTPDNEPTPPDFVTPEELAVRDEALAIILFEQEQARNRPGYPDGSLRFRLANRIQTAHEYGHRRALVLELKRHARLLDLAAAQADAVERKRAGARAGSAKAFNF